VGITFFQAAFDAIPLGIAFVILFASLFIDGQVAVGIGDRLLTGIAIYFTQRYTTTSHLLPPYELT
jgi:hypothetical protein